MKIYLVGGAVRDLLLGKNPKDKDYVVVGATPEEMVDLGFSQVGKDFPVFLHPQTGEEYALARKERKTGLGYHGFECDFSQNITLEEDLYRRDLTINAMAYDLDNKKVIDPYNGKQDLKNNLIRHVSHHFKEDPLRLLRACRFSARYNFSIAKETESFLIEMVENGELNNLSNERVWTEFEKALSEKNSYLFFENMQKLKALNIFPGFEDKYIRYTFLDKLDNIDSKVGYIFSHLQEDDIKQYKMTSKQFKYIQSWKNNHEKIIQYLELEPKDTLKTLLHLGAIQDNTTISQLVIDLHNMHFLVNKDSILKKIENDIQKIQNIDYQKLIDNQPKNKIKELVEEARLEVLSIKNNKSIPKP